MSARVLSFAVGESRRPPARSYFNGYMDGDVRSGERAAAEVARAR